MSPNRDYVLPHAFVLKIGGEETRIQRIVAFWDLPKYDSLITGKK
jgi:hypothetical protein